MKQTTKKTICLTLAILIVSIYALAGPIPDTGITKCYNNTEEIPCPQPGEPFYGQDGNYIINPPSYTKLDAHGNDLPDSATEWVMVRDNVTGLIWEVKTDDGSVHDKDNEYTWYNSDAEINGGKPGTSGDGTDTEDFIRTLNESSFGEFSAWKLPTIKELIYLTNLQKEKPSINLSYFLYTVTSRPNNIYWSSSIDKYWNPYYVSFDYGTLGYGISKSNSLFVRAVQGKPSWRINHCVMNGDGTITDVKTGLMWQIHTSKLNWEESLSYCESLKLAIFNDWRLPNREELFSIFDYTKKEFSFEYGKTNSYDNYWSSSTIVDRNSQAWTFENKSGIFELWGKSESNYVRAVRGGQRYLLNHLYILNPKQAARWNTGTNQTIMWDTKSIDGNVQISLSRQGGKEGTFEIIADNTENDGNYTWTVNGPESFNCVLKIEPLNEPSKGNTQGLFSISTPKEIYLSAQQHYMPDKYSLSLFGFYTGGPFPIETDWHCAAPYTIKDNVLTGNQNGWAEVTTTYQEKTYKKWLPIYTKQEYREIETNNTINKAFPIENEKFYNASFYTGDMDYFQIDLPSNSIIQVKYNSLGYIADMKVSVIDSNNKLMASNISYNGKPLTFPLGLSAGKYYVKCESAGDVDEDNDYVITYKSIQDLPSKTIVQLPINQEKQDAIHNFDDHSDFLFTQEENKGTGILFTAATEKYHIEVIDENQTIIDQVNYLEARSVKLEAIYPPGDYIVRISPIDDVDATNVFTIERTYIDHQVESEPNNTYTQSTDFHTDHSIKGRISTMNDTDFYSFQLDMPKYLELSLLCGNQTNFDLTLYKDSDKNQIGSITFQYDNILPMRMGLGVGRYFLKLTGSESNLHYYTLSIQESIQTNLEIEPNNNIKFANAISKDSSRIGTIYSSSDIDYYGFYLPSPSIFSVNYMTASQTGDNKISIVDSNDQVIELRHSPDGKTCTIDSYNYPGNYYIKIENNGTVDQYSAYTLNISSEVPIEGLKQVTSIIISGDTTEMQISDTKYLTVTVAYSDASSEVVAAPDWQSLNENVATVNADGMVSAIGEGSTSIIAVYSGLVAKFDIIVGAPVQDMKQHHGNLILVAGGGIEATNTLKESTQFLCDMIYKRFKERLFQDEDIYYFNPFPHHDLDGDGNDDSIVDNVKPTVDAFKKSITEWAPSKRTDGPLFIYLIDHGEIDKFKIFPFQILSSIDLNTFLNTFQDLTSRDVVLMIEACKSGSFIDDISFRSNRVIITSTNNKNAFLDVDGRISFTQFFMDNLYSGFSLSKAFMFARKKLLNMISPYSNMEPQLPPEMAPFADKVHIGGNFVIADLSPEILEISPNQTVTANEPHTFYVKMAGMIPMKRVWAVVIPPGYTPPEISHDFEAPEVRLPIFHLSPSNQENHFEGIYNGFRYNDIYRIQFFAASDKGNVSVSQMIEVTVQGGSALDSDGDGMPNDWENLYSALNKDTKDSSDDPDQDGLTNLQEYLHNANPTNIDTDNDSMPDGWEVNWGLNPLENDANNDADNDGVSNAIEFQDQTNPISNSSFLDHILPKVISTTPASGDINIDQDSFIKVEFSEPMNADLLSINHISINGSISNLFQAKLSYDTVRHILTIIPENYFDFGETVTVKLKNTLTDIAGNPLDGNGNGQSDPSPNDDYIWSFEIVPPNPYDSNEDWTISDFELLNAIDEWAVDRMLEQMKDDCDIDFYLLNVIDIWKGDLYGYDQERWEECFPWELIE
jgi:hypothetical protein